MKCPSCHWTEMELVDEIERVYECPLCGEWIYEDELGGEDAEDDWETQGI